ncbi:hypothetical protein BDV12DRAFT_187098 [Aspergillus spectabilis]
MPRKDFHRDLAAACLPGIFPRVTDVKDGGEDGLLSFTYTNISSCLTIRIEVIVSDTADYPVDHQYYVYTTTENIPETVSSVLGDSHSAFSGLTVQKFLRAIAEHLDDATLDGEDDYATDEYQYFDEMDWEEDTFEPSKLTERENNTNENYLREKIRSDLINARDAGYRVGYLGELNGSVILSASCRISNMGISLEAMEALNVRCAEFLVLLIRYAHGYRPFSDVVRGSDGGIRLHAGVCDFYKPSLSSARLVFASTGDVQTGKSDAATALPPEEPVLKSIFIEKSLHALLNTRFIQILKCRLDYAFTWTGAEVYLNDGQGRLLESKERGDPKYFRPDNWDASSPAFLSEDCLADTKNPSNLSLLLIAMQFTLRRFVKCTEFCLNCFCKIDVGFEALKPFVCSKGLCLYQYMALGMGPSLEWEISTQPQVIDLLISFAYARAASKTLEDFPTGLQLRVPRIPGDSYNPASTDSKAQWQMTANGGISLRLSGQPKIIQGNWIVLNPSTDPLHARVMDTSQWPNIYLSGPRTYKGTPMPRTQFEPTAVTFVAYDTDFDSLSPPEKSKAICDLLNTLPTVTEMKDFIKGEHGYLRPLSQWQERIHPSTLCILQWIVGSNRSVLLYDDDPQHHVSGMENYVQFRFAQGAPDKEQRFVTSVNQAASRTHNKHPTIFAWHGSPLHNWHSIVREGLHFNYMANGRSCGNGIYMSPHFCTSLGYCMRAHGGSNRTWENSEMNFKSAISLNEIVNDSASFISTHPHYVVSQLDWVQPRYLFVESASEATKQKKEKSQPLPHAYPQDPARLVHGPTNARLEIPISATNSHRTKGQSRPQKNGLNSRKRKRGKAPLISIGDGADAENAGDDYDDANSVSTLLEDKLLLLSDDENIGPESDQHYLTKTDFRPGSLNASSIRLMGEPTYATARATRSLQKLLREALKTQNEEPLHELGWYINAELINNVYQWIVELHSFDKSLQVAKDLKQAGLTSLVLELRFPSLFPLSPPFIRIIRPRFIRFAEGGGGHITAGGAMCMQLLTNSGWLPSFSIESILLQVRLAIMNEIPRPARLDSRHQGSDYSVGEAIVEYKRVCTAHGWTIPKDIEEIQW